MGRGGVSAALNWCTLMRDNNPAFLVKGSELACLGLIAARASCSMRYARGCRAPKASANLSPIAPDACSVSDAEARDGKRPLVTFRCDTDAEALAWCAAQTAEAT